MDPKNQLLHIKRRVFQVSEYVYFGMLIALTIYMVLRYACLELVWEELGSGVPVLQLLVDSILLHPNKVLLVLVIIRFICSERYKAREIVTAIFIYVLVSHAVELNGYSEVLTMILLMLGARGISFKKIIKVYFTVVAVLVIGVMLASQIGLIENRAYNLNGRNIQLAFGFSYSTRFASHIFFLLLWYWYLRDSKLKYWESLLPIAAGIFVWIFSRARLSTICSFLLAGVMLCQTFQFRRAKRRETAYHMNPYCSCFLSMSVTFATIIITALTVLYTPDNVLLNKLDRILSNRLFLSNKAMNIYGFQWWGQWIRLAGNGGHLNGNLKYFYIDSALMQFSIQYGLILLVLFLVLFWVIGIRARKNQCWVILWVLAFSALHAMIEPQLLQLQYCPLLLALYAKINDDAEERNSHEET